MQTSFVSDAARHLHHDAVIIDGLSGSIHQGYQQAVKGGVTALNVSMGGASDKPELKSILRAASENQMIVEAFPDELVEVMTSQDILRAKAEGKLGVIFGTQSADFLGTDIFLVPLFHRLGLRIMQLTYSERNEIGYGVAEPKDHGLTAFGYRVIRELNRLGVLIDLSHVGYVTAGQAIAYSEQPVVFSHSNAHRLTPNHRNIPDELMTACAEKGGVIGICLYATLCETTQGRRPTVEDWVKHVDHAVNLVGIDHVGISTDMFEGRTKYWHAMRGQFVRYKDTYSSYSTFEARHVQGLDTLAELPIVTQALMDSGYDEAKIRKILGLNFLRVYSSVWDAKADA